MSSDSKQNNVGKWIGFVVLTIACGFDLQSTLFKNGFL